MAGTKPKASSGKDMRLAANKGKSKVKAPAPKSKRGK